VKRAKKHQKLEKVKERKALREKEISIKKAEKKLKKGRIIKKPKDNNDDGDWEDVDEHEKDVFDKDGYFDVPEGDAQISANDEKLLKTL
jgi:hypothetical protein